MLSKLALFLSLIGAVVISFNSAHNCFHVLPHAVLPQVLDRLLLRSGWFFLWAGALPSLVGAICSIIAFRRQDRSRFDLAVCLWSVSVFVGCFLSIFFASSPA
jgi:hypothetical protein